MPRIQLLNNKIERFMRLYQVDGATKIIALIGDSITTAQIPTRLNKMLAEQSKLGEYLIIPWHVSAAGLADTLQALRSMQNFIGAIVTATHKTQVLQHLDEVAPDAESIQVVNVITRCVEGKLAGWNYDGAGFVRGLEQQGHQVRQKKFVLIGAGGAAASVAFALLSRGCAELILYNRNPNKAKSLIEQLYAHFPKAKLRLGLAENEAMDVIINASAIGIDSTSELPIDEVVLQRAGLVAECIATKEKTALLTLAEKYTEIHSGIHMLVGQLELICDLFLSTQASAQA